METSKLLTKKEVRALFKISNAGVPSLVKAGIIKPIKVNERLVRYIVKKEVMENE